MINQRGLELVKEFEGLRLQAYKDSGGTWSIGYGTTRDVEPDDVVTPQWAETRLLEDLGLAERQLKSHVKVPLNSNQLSALISFVYNLGVGNFERSTLLRSINKHQWQAAADSMLLWNKVNGVPHEGLERRRNAERSLFMDPDIV